MLLLLKGALRLLEFASHPAAPTATTAPKTKSQSTWISKDAILLFPPTLPRVLLACVHVTHQTGPPPSRIPPPTRYTICSATVVYVTTNTLAASLRIPSLSRGANPALILASFLTYASRPSENPSLPPTTTSTRSTWTLYLATPSEIWVTATPSSSSTVLPITSGSTA